jgi:hypothetical protein
MNDIKTQGAFLILFRTSVWNGTKVLPQKVMDQIRRTNLLKGRKNLVDPKYIRPIHNAAALTRSRLAALTLPFPVPGFFMAPKDLLDQIEKVLEDGKKEFLTEVDNFINNKFYPAIEAAEQELGPELFNRNDYPFDIRSKFDINGQYFTLDAPNEASILDPALYKREKERFTNLVTEASEAAIATLRSEFAELITHITERLEGKEDGKPKIFRDSMLKNIEEFFDTFSARNDLVNDETLADLVKQAKATLRGVDPDILRDSDGLRRIVKQNLDVVKEEIDKAITDVPLRKIRLAA